MKYAILAFAIVLGGMAAAKADGPFNREKCILAGGTKEFCSKERVKPPEMGWWCDYDLRDAVKGQGGFKHRRDALTYCNVPVMGWLCDLTTNPPTVVRAEGGTKDKRDALAHCE